MISKALTFSLTLLAFAPAALACPGGHLKTLQTGHLVLGEIDMHESTISVTGDAKLLSLTTLASTGGEPEILCENPYRPCAEPAKITIASRPVAYEPDGIVKAVIQYRDDAPLTFVVSSFTVTRAFSACGAEIQPEN